MKTVIIIFTLFTMIYYRTWRMFLCVKDNQSTRSWSFSSNNFRHWWETRRTFCFHGGWYHRTNCQDSIRLSIGQKWVTIIFENILSACFHTKNNFLSTFNCINKWQNCLQKTEKSVFATVKKSVLTTVTTVLSTVRTV